MTEWTRESDPEVAAFHHHEDDMTETIRFLVWFFIGTTILAGILLTGAILGISWLVNRG